MSQTTRRAFLGATAVAAIAATIPASAAAGEDAAIIEAWERRKAAYLEFNAHPLIGTGDLVGDQEEERLWAIIDEAEAFIRQTTAKTPQGIEVQLWMALYHSVSLTHNGDSIVLRGDLPAVEQIESGLDWNARIIVAAIRSARSMAT